MIWPFKCKRETLEATQQSMEFLRFGKSLVDDLNTTIKYIRGDILLLQTELGYLRGDVLRLQTEMRQRRNPEGPAEEK